MIIYDLKNTMYWSVQSQGFESTLRLIHVKYKIQFKRKKKYLISQCEFVGRVDQLGRCWGC